MGDSQSTVEVDQNGVLRMDIQPFVLWVLDDYIPKDFDRKPMDYNQDSYIAEYEPVGSINYERLPGFAPLNSRGYPINAKWEDFSLTIRSNYRLEIIYKNEPPKINAFTEIGLTNRLNNLPNRSAFLLGMLATDGRLRVKGKYTGMARTSVSRLASILRSMTGISAYPFSRFSKKEGLKPIFKLKDDQRNAVNRLEDKAIYMEYSEARKYLEEDDSAGNWLLENG